MQMRQVGDGVLMTVRVRPRSRPGVDTRHDILLIRVAASPVEGRATEEARRALARAVGAPASRVTLVSGARSRTKVFLIAGATVPEVAAVIEDLA
jgi:uncharacterized protein YggU (UPF0235/DUF167 family)